MTLLAPKGSITVMSEPEVCAAVASARAFHRREHFHANGSDAVKRAACNEVDIIYHCESADEEALDLLKPCKDQFSSVPRWTQS